MSAPIHERIPISFGTYRTAAVLDSQRGWCCCCDLPIPSNPRGRRRRYTCGNSQCLAWWQLCCNLDAAERLKQAAA